MNSFRRRPGRVFELFVYLNSIGWAIILALPGDTVTYRSGFAPLYRAGWTEPLLTATMGILGTMGAMALWVNGLKPRGSPKFRSVAAAGAVFVYSQISAALIVSGTETGAPYAAGVSTYSLLALFSLYCCYNSSREVQ